MCLMLFLLIVSLKFQIDSWHAEQMFSPRSRRRQRVLPLFQERQQRVLLLMTVQDLHVRTEI